MRKFISSIIVLALIFSLCSCKGNSDTPSHGKEDHDFYYSNTVLPYCANDLLNPYTAETKFNKYIASLLFEPLVKLDETFTPHTVLAQDVKIENNKCTVTLKEVKFSDGNALTSADVVYSLSFAKSSPAYAARFDSIVSFTASGDHTVIITLKNSDENFIGLLDMPIIKNGTGNLVDSRNLSIPPTGTGPYVIDTDKEILSLISEYHGDKPNSEIIYLINTPDTESLTYNISNGRLTSWMSSEKIKDAEIISGKTLPVNTNSLVFIGINLGEPRLSQPEIRYSLNVGFDRSALINTVFEGFALAADGIYNPLWSKIKGLQSISSDVEENILVAYLDEIGYNKKDADGIYLKSGASKLSFSLLFCNENPIRERLAYELSSQYRKVGIEIKPTGVPYNDYIAALESGSFELYLGEVSILKNMDISSLLCEGGALAYGILYPHEEEKPDDSSSDDTSSTETSSEMSQNDSTSSDDSDVTGEERDESSEEIAVINTCGEAITDYYSGEGTLSDIVNIFNLEMPLIPICYRQSILSVSKRIAGPAEYYFDRPYDPTVYATVNN